MNKLSKTIMAIAVAGSLLFGGVLSSQAADFFASNQDASRDGQSGNQRSGELSDGVILFDDDEIPIPGNDAPWCEATGKITQLQLTKTNAFLSIAHNTEDQYTRYKIDGAANDFSHPLHSKIITEAWLRNLTVKVFSLGQCEVKNNGSLDGGSALTITILQEPTE